MLVRHILFYLGVFAMRSFFRSSLPVTLPLFVMVFPTLTLVFIIATFLFSGTITLHPGYPWFPGMWLPLLGFMLAVGAMFYYRAGGSVRFWYSAGAACFLALMFIGMLFLWRSHPGVFILFLPGLGCILAAGAMVCFLVARGFRSQGFRLSCYTAFCLVLVGVGLFAAYRFPGELLIEPAGGQMTSADSSGSYYDSGPLLPPAQSLPKQPSARAAQAPQPPAPPAPQAPAAPAPPVSTGGVAPVNDASFDAMFFRDYGTNPFIDTDEDHLSTFAVDVDSASYTLARNYILSGQAPEPAGVRVEEFLNYFDYGYGPPEDGSAFAAHLEGAPSLFGTERHVLLRIGLQGRGPLPSSQRRPVSVIFTVDASGSMDDSSDGVYPSPNSRLELAKAFMRSSLESLGPRDRVGIVVYHDSAGIYLPVGDPERASVMRAIDGIVTGGATYAAAGLQLAFEVADDEVDGERNVRIILLSDGVANVGETGPDSILESVREHAGRRIYLSSIGVGLGNYNDVLMERLANDGDGFYHYLDGFDEVTDVVRRRLPGILDVIAREAKVQVEFNPEVVRSYRLLGYENRDVADEDFRNDQVDAGEIGAGHSVTALYEVKLHPEQAGLMATVRMRHEDPETGLVEEADWEFLTEDVLESAEDASRSYLLAAYVAQYGEILSQSFWARDESLEALTLMSEDLPGLFPGDLRVQEFEEVVHAAWTILGE